MSDTNMPEGSDAERDDDAPAGDGAEMSLSRRDAITGGAAAVAVGLGATHALTEGTDVALSVSSGVFAVEDWMYSDSASTLEDVHISGASYLDLSWSGFREGDELDVYIDISAHDDGDSDTNTHFAANDPAYEPEQVLKGTITLDSIEATDERFHFDTDIVWDEGSVPRSIVSDGDGTIGHPDMFIEDHFEPDEDDYIDAEDHYQRVTYVEGDIAIDSDAPLKDAPVEVTDSAAVTVQYDYLTDIPQGGIGQLRLTSDGTEASGLNQLGFVDGGEEVEDVTEVGFV